MGSSSDRSAAVAQLRDVVLAAGVDHTVRVAVDGITGAGKTTLAGELADAVAAAGRAALRLTMDGYHHPRAHRYRQGRMSADGYYEDAYDLAAFADLVLRPLGPGGDGTYVTAVLDLAADEPVRPEPVTAPAGAVLVVDGSFLQRPELAGLWDVVIWVDTGFDEARRRGVARDTDLLGGEDKAAAAFDQRYQPANRRYLHECDPVAGADAVVTNDDVERPTVVFRR